MTRSAVEAQKRKDAEKAFYVDDEELRRRINPLMGRDRFLLAIAALEGRKSPGGKVFPKVSTLFGGRYWPHVTAYLDDFEKAEEHDDSADFTEQLQQPQPHAHFRRKTRPQVHKADGSALLGGSSGGPEHNELSGSVHRLAARR